MADRLFQLLTLLILNSPTVIHAQADFDFVRYDVSFASQHIGHMVFDNTGPVPGNIFPNIVDWEFTFDGFRYDPSNTVVAGNFFAVDENYIFQADLGAAPPAFPPPAVAH